MAEHHDKRWKHGRGDGPRNSVDPHQIAMDELNNLSQIFGIDLANEERIERERSTRDSFTDELEAYMNKKPQEKTQSRKRSSNQTDLKELQQRVTYYENQLLEAEQAVYTAKQNVEKARNDLAKYLREALKEVNPAEMEAEQLRHGELEEKNKQINELMSLVHTLSRELEQQQSEINRPKRPKADFDKPNDRHRAPRGREVGPREFGSREFGPREFGPREFGPRDFGPREFKPRDNRAREFPRRENGPQGDFSTVRCYQCQAFGHIGKECPNKNSGLQICFSCKKPASHMAYECPSKPRIVERGRGRGGRLPRRGGNHMSRG